jgi:hypothetical protein
MCRRRREDHAYALNCENDEVKIVTPSERSDMLLTNTKRGARQRNGITSPSGCNRHREPLPGCARVAVVLIYEPDRVARVSSDGHWPGNPAAGHERQRPPWAHRLRYGDRDARRRRGAEDTAAPAHAHEWRPRRTDELRRRSASSSRVVKVTSSRAVKGGTIGDHAESLTEDDLVVRPLLQGRRAHMRACPFRPRVCLNTPAWENKAWPSEPISLRSPHLERPKASSAMS